MSDLEEIISGQPQEPEAVEPEKVEAEPEQPEQAEPEAEETPKEDEKAEPKDIPYPVFKSTRDDLKAQLDDARKRLDQYEQEKQKPQEQPLPDVFEDQGGFVKSIQQQVANATLSARLDISETMARESYGDEVVNEAFAAAKAANKGNEFIHKPHAYGEMVKWHQRQQAMQEIGDPVSYKERIAAEVRQQIEAEMAAKQAKDMAGKAPPSMANVNGSGGQRDPGWQGPSALDAIIGE